MQLKCTEQMHFTLLKKVENQQNISAIFWWSASGSPCTTALRTTANGKCIFNPAANFLWQVARPLSARFFPELPAFLQGRESEVARHGISNMLFTSPYCLQWCSCGQSPSCPLSTTLLWHALWLKKYGKTWLHRHASLSIRERRGHTVYTLVPVSNLVEKFALIKLTISLSCAVFLEGNADQITGHAT